MAPGKETRFGHIRRGIVAPIRKIHLFLEKTLNVRFCYENSIQTVARAYGLISSPFSLVCGVVAMFFGTFHMIQGALSLSASGVTFVLELPLMPDLCKTIRKYPLRRAFLYSIFSLPLFLSWYTLLPAVMLLSLSGIYMYTFYLPNSGAPMLDDEEYLNTYNTKRGSEDEEEDYYNYDDDDDDDEGEQTKENYNKKILKEIRVLYNDNDSRSSNSDDDYLEHISEDDDYTYESNQYTEPLSTVKTKFLN